MERILERMMSKTVGLTCLSAIAMVAMPITSASAFHPFDEPAGYQVPDWSKRKAAKANPAGNPANPAKKNQASSFFGGDDDEDQPVKPQQRVAKPSAVQNPPVLDGGGRPEISPSAPPVVTSRVPGLARSSSIQAGARSTIHCRLRRLTAIRSRLAAKVSRGRGRKRSAASSRGPIGVRRPK